MSLLPYLEEQSLFDQFDLSKKVTNNSRDPQSHQPASLLCPSDDARGRQFEVVEPDGGRTVPFGKANYAAFANVYHIDAWFYTAAMRLYGQPLRKITDGTSATLVFAEIRTREHTHDQRGAWRCPGPDRHCCRSIFTRRPAQTRTPARTSRPMITCLGH